MRARDSGHAMKTGLSQIIAVLFSVFLCPCFAQVAESNEKLAEQARRECTGGNFADAERDFRELAKLDPSNVEDQVYLGQSLFRQEKYIESVLPYEKARELEKRGSKLTSDQHRILVDQLAMAYGISSNPKKALALLERAIRDDPEYPLNYYNLACVYAEEGTRTRCSQISPLRFSTKSTS